MRHLIAVIAALLAVSCAKHPPTATVSTSTTNAPFLSPQTKAVLYLARKALDLDRFVGDITNSLATLEKTP